MISISAPLLFVHSLLATMAGVSMALGTLLPFPSLDRPTAFDAPLPGERRRYLRKLAKRKWEKRQKGDKKVNKPGLFMLFLVVSSEVLAISSGALPARSTSSGGGGSNSTAHSAAVANATTLCEPETKVSSSSGFLLHNTYVMNLSNSSPRPTSSCSLAPSSSFR